MDEGVIGITSAEVLPGTYDVLGDAGDTVFAGQVSVTAEGPNDFVIPVSAAVSPAGPDAEPVPVTVTGPYMGTFRQWTAIPLPDGDALRSDGAVNAPWTVNLLPGTWLVTATASGAPVEGLAGIVDVTAAGPVTVGQPTFAPAVLGGSAVFQRVCDGDAPCIVYDAPTGLRTILAPGWAMQDPPFFVQTAAGIAATVPSTQFGTRDSGDVILAALNPRQWDASLGPCEETAAGQLCRVADMPDDALAGYRVIAATLRVAGAAAPQVPAIEGTPLNLDADTAATLRNRLYGIP